MKKSIELLFVTVLVGALGCALCFGADAAPLDAAKPAAAESVGSPHARLERLPRCEPEGTSSPAANIASPAGFVGPAEPSAIEFVPRPQALATTNLGEAIDTALARNPNLVAMRQTDPVSRAALGVARTYPYNPWVQVQVLPFSRELTGGTTPVSHYVLVMQTLELAHQRRFRTAAGQADLSRIDWTIRQAELTNIALTERMFLTAIYQRGVRDLTLSLAKLNEELVGILDRRFNAGTAVGSDLALARLQAHAARQQANLAITAYNTALLDLRTQLGLVSGEPFEPLGDLTRLAWLPAPLNTAADGKPADGDVVALVSARPDVMAARADVDFGRAGADLARANRVPNVQAGPYYARDDFATVFVGLRTQMDIPIWNTGTPLLRQRLAELRQREIALDQLQIRARLEAVAALERYERARRLTSETQAQFGEMLDEDERRVENQFQAGQADLLRVYSARTGVIQAERAQLDTLNELGQAASRVTETTGLPPHVLIHPPAGSAPSRPRQQPGPPELPEP